MADIQFHHQLFRHDPANGVFGDCYRTAIACLLGLQPENVPNFAANTKSPLTADRDASTWLAERGYSMVKQWRPGGIADLLGIMRRVGCDNTGAYYLLTGRSATGCNHVVICRNDRIAHDPSHDNVGIIGPAFGDPTYGFVIEFLGVHGGAISRAA